MAVGKFPFTSEDENPPYPFFFIRTPKSGRKYLLPLLPRRNLNVRDQSRTNSAGFPPEEEKGTDANEREERFH